MTWQEKLKEIEGKDFRTHKYFIEEIIENLIDDTDEYFKGLVMAPDIQATRKNLVSQLRNKYLTK